MLVEEKVKETNKIIVQSVPDSFFVLPDSPPKEQKNKIFENQSATFEASQAEIEGKGGGGYSENG